MVGWSGANKMTRATMVIVLHTHIVPASLVMRSMHRHVPGARGVQHMASSRFALGCQGCWPLRGASNLGLRTTKCSLRFVITMMMKRIGSVGF